jgi:hypothetical protein
MSRMAGRPPASSSLTKVGGEWHAHPARRRTGCHLCDFHLLGSFAGKRFGDHPDTGDPCQRAVKPALLIPLCSLRRAGMR